MHELSAVEGLVTALLRAPAIRDAEEITAVRVRRGSAFSEDALIQGFELLAQGTPLETARLQIEVREIAVDCSCGLRSHITPDDLVGHMHVCPGCGALRDIPGAAALELVSVSTGIGREIGLEP